MRVVIVGGGVMGSAAAFFLARDHGVAVTVLERDASYRIASSALSASSIRQQFSCAVNIRLSQASLEFFRRIGDELAVDGERPDIGLVEPGYLFLATAAGVEALRANYEQQRECGAPVAWLSKGDLRERWPWLSIDGLAAACLGERGEGWFDGYSVLRAFRRKAISLGVRYVQADVRTLHAASVACADGASYAGDALLISAGAWSALLAAQRGALLPVRARKRDVFVFTAPATLPDCPLVIDPSGVWFRPEGRGFICGAPPRGVDADDPPLDSIDHGLFDETIWPRLAARVPAFEALRMTNAWAGYYELNTFDHNGLVGALPGHDRVFTACGFSGHGMQQAPAVGRAIAELIATGKYQTLDVSALDPARVLRNEPLLERNVI